ncbi:MAG: ComEC/Rec2 family competence protein [Spirochaetales bacterium]|nr:ComEC/Rec2 family competence protein [Spirochaetales bacterium]
MSALVPAAVAAAAAYALVPANISTVLVFLAAACGIALSGIQRGRLIGITLLVCSAGVILGMGSRAAVASSLQQAPALPPGQISRLWGVAVGHSERTEDGRQIAVRVNEIGVENLRTSADLSVILSYDGPEPAAPGSPLQASITGLQAARGGGWYASAVEVFVGEPSIAGRVRSGIYYALAGAIERSAGTGAPLLKALLLGVDTDLTARTEELFRRAGVSHVLALSGMHLAIVAALVVALALPLFGRRVALVSGAVVALAYTLLIGGRPSLVRATIMCEITLLLILFERPLHLVEVVSAAFLVHLLAQPTAIAEVSFQLSYLALLGISVIAPGLIREMRPWLPTPVAAPLSAGVGAQVAGSPVLFGVFGRLYPIGIVAGAVIGPLVAIFMTAGIIGVAVSMIPVPAIALVSSRLLSAMAALIEHAAWWFSGAPGVAGERLAVPAGFAALACLGWGMAVERRRLLWTGRR